MQVQSVCRPLPCTKSCFAAARIALEPKTTTQAQVSQAPNGHGNSNLKCRTGYSTKWHTEYKNQGTTRYPGVMCQNNRRHHLGHCISFCQQCTRRLGRHVAGFNFGPGCRCYSASQVRQVQLTGTGWDFCTRSKGNKAVSKSPQAPRAGNSNQAKIKHPLSPNATASKKDTKAFHTSNCPVKTLYARTCWAESARKHCTKFPPQMVVSRLRARMHRWPLRTSSCFDSCVSITHLLTRAQTSHMAIVCICMYHCDTVLTPQNAILSLGVRSGYESFTEPRENVPALPLVLAEQFHLDALSQNRCAVRTRGSPMPIEYESLNYYLFWCICRKVFE